MKTIVRFLSLLFIVSAVGCVKHVTPKQPTGGDTDKPENFQELNVPANFDWKTTKAAVANFVSVKHKSIAYVSLDGAKEPFASFYVGEGMDKVTLNVPSDVNELSVQYLKEDGLSNVAKIGIANGVAQYTVPDDSKAVDMLNRSMSRGGGDKDGVIYYPAATMGTLMFEDQWPAYADYDFNDFVLNYRIQLNLHNANKVSQMHITLRVAALGGSLPFEVYMQLAGVKGGEIRDNLIVKKKNNVKEPVITLVNSDGNSDKNPALFALTGIKENAKRPSGGSFLNTSKGFEMPQADMVEIEVYIDFRNSIALEALEMDKIDFFIGQAIDDVSMKEIHVRGEMPSRLGQSVYEKLKAESPIISASHTYYCSNTNLVWAINIPEVIPHAYESKSFLEAYPEFTKWAKSGGQESKDWYKAGKRVEELLVK